MTDLPTRIAKEISLGRSGGIPDRVTAAKVEELIMGASVSQAGLGSAAAPEPHSGLGPTGVIPSASWLDDNLTREEARAFLAFFAGAWSNIRIFVGPDGKTWPISFGKAECEWVPFHETWEHKFPGLGLTTFEESEPKPALGMAPGSTWTEAKIRVTEFGWAVRDAYWNRDSDATRRAETETGSGA